MDNPFADDIGKLIESEPEEGNISFKDQLFLILNGSGFSVGVTQEATALASMIRSTALTLKYVPIPPILLDSMPEPYMDFVYYLWNKEFDKKVNTISL